MFKVILFIIAGFFIYPLVMYETSDPCSATEKKLWEVFKNKNKDLIIIEALLAGTDYYVSGTIAKEVAKKEYDQVPPFLTCTAMYWYFQLDENAPKEALSYITEEDIEEILTKVFFSSPSLIRELLSY